MKMLEKSQDRIQQICTVLREETLEPAKMEALKIVEAANEEAKAIIEKAKNEALRLIEEARSSALKEREVFETALRESSRLSIEHLRQEIEAHLFNPQLEEVLLQQTADPKVVARLIDVLVETIQKEGTSTDFSALIPKKISPEAINGLIEQQVLARLKEKSVLLGDFLGGAQLKLRDKNITLDLTHETLSLLLQRHMRKSFRKWLFGPGT